MISEKSIRMHDNKNYEKNISINNVSYNKKKKKIKK